MASKETDELTVFPTTFLEHEGTKIVAALEVLKKHGCVRDRTLEMRDFVSSKSIGEFSRQADKFKIREYFSLGMNLDNWRRWIAEVGPVIVRGDMDSSWLSVPNRCSDAYCLTEASTGERVGGHAFALVGYDSDTFIARNSAGGHWGHKGHVRIGNKYVKSILTEAYGIAMD
ncbi:C1 family peptidase [Agarivorans sp. OAG1]|uniref:C1 family peptidase n=1 Tax=Agarivorans sp. OAG1 TaxID=3082387 RepID=UPI0030CDADA8